MERSESKRRKVTTEGAGAPSPGPSPHVDSFSLPHSLGEVGGGGRGNHGCLQAATRTIESLLFVSTRPLSPKDLGKLLGLSPETIRSLVMKLQDEYRERGIQVREVAGGYRMATHPESAAYVHRILENPQKDTLSKAALETLAIIAYKQPIAKVQIEGVRGVRVEKIMRDLLDRGLIRELGRADAPGRPFLYGTTEAFLESFGLRSIHDLPPLEQGGLQQSD